MSVAIFINYTENPVRNYVGWTPARCAVRTTDGTPRTVVLRNGDTTKGGQLSFLLTVTSEPANEIEIDLPPENGNVDFFVAGKFDDNAGRGYPSSEDGDASIEVVEKRSGALLLLERLMVRVRKNANTLTDGERDRFLSALVLLNQRGDFVDFQNMHTTDTSREIHGRSCFLPWHRLLLLDLERKLQAIDQSVTLPYWRFDQAAPNVFTRDFIGVPDLGTGLVEFSSTNPLINWRATVFGEGSGRIRRALRARPDGSVWDPTREPALIDNDETATINLGTIGTVSSFQNFERMEADPHGSAHVSFNGQISDIGRAPADPLFFMLHANVDRLWAKWQWLRNRFDPALSETYYKRGTGPINPDPSRANADRIGNYLEDTLWPWNGIVGDPRPRTAPGTYYPRSPFLNVPGRYPTIRSCVDFLGQIDRNQALGFCYDDVPYDLA